MRKIAAKIRFEVDPHMVKNRHEYRFPRKFFAAAKLAKIGQLYIAIAGKLYIRPLSFVASC